MQSNAGIYDILEVENLGHLYWKRSAVKKLTIFHYAECRYTALNYEEHQYLAYCK